MTQLFEMLGQVPTSNKNFFSSNQRLAQSSNPKSPEVRQELGQKIHAALQSAKDLPLQDCLTDIRTRLLEIQAYCASIGKAFIVIEERIACNQYDLGCCHHHTATLFRGPREDASVAICVTDQGSLLHRNHSEWQVYRNVGDIQCSIPNIPQISG